MWTLQYRNGLYWTDLESHRFFLSAWLHARQVEKNSQGMQLQIVRRVA